VDATGHGGWEVLQLLGLGLWVAVVSALWLSRGRRLPWRRHLGSIILALLGCTALALSLRVGLGERVLASTSMLGAGLLHPVPRFGRFFWPVAYALLVASGRPAGPRRASAAAACLLLCAALQFLDATPQREALRAWAAEKPPWTIEADALRPLLATASRHSVVPAWACVPKEDWQTRSRILEILLLASETPRPVNTMYAARWREPPACVPPGPLLPGELRLVLPGEDPGAQGCTAIGDLLACRRPSGPGG
jgi:hypothetical protein